MATTTEILARPLATVAEVVEIVPISKGEVYAQIKRGDLESVRVGKRVLVKTDSIRRLLEGGSATPAA